MKTGLSIAPAALALASPALAQVDDMPTIVAPERQRMNNLLGLHREKGC